jgi:hypothetical protein
MLIALDKHRAAARQIMADPAMLDLLHVVFTPERSKVREELEENMVAFPDADYGQAMKALVLSERHFKHAMAVLNQLAQNNDDKPGAPVAPK